MNPPNTDEWHETKRRVAAYSLGCDCFFFSIDNPPPTRHESLKSRIELVGLHAA